MSFTTAEFMLIVMQDGASRSLQDGGMVPGRTKHIISRWEISPPPSSSGDGGKTRDGVIKNSVFGLVNKHVVMGARFPVWSGHRSSALLPYVLFSMHLFHLFVPELHP